MKPLQSTRIPDQTRLLPDAVSIMLLHDLAAEIVRSEDSS